jgi:sugar O-acyltransferase (sialic acid O-acetyltransferase NeuD family)
MDRQAFIVGAGGHAKVVYDAICEKGCQSNVFAALDDDPALIGRSLLDKVTILQTDSVLCKSETLALEKKPIRDVYVAIGCNNARQRIAIRFQSAECYQFPTLYHPTARVSRFAHVGRGTFIGDRAICEADAKIGEFAIINTGSIVTHDCVIGDFVHVAPGCVLCGRVTVGRSTLLGANSTVLPGVCIGQNCTIGAGAIVTRNIPDNSIVRGEPAKIRK